MNSRSVCKEQRCNWYRIYEIYRTPVPAEEHHATKIRNAVIMLACDEQVVAAESQLMQHFKKL